MGMQISLRACFRFFWINTQKWIVGLYGGSSFKFWGTSILFSVVAIPIYIPTNHILESPLLRFLGGGDLVAKSCLTLATPWTLACQASLSMGLSRQEYWSGLPFPSPISYQHFIFFFFFLLKAMLSIVRWYLVVLIYISLMISDVEHISFLFIYNLKNLSILAILGHCCWAFL